LSKTFSNNTAVNAPAMAPDTGSSPWPEAPNGFVELGLGPAAGSGGGKDLGFTQPTTVQLKAIPIGHGRKAMVMPMKRRVLSI
jgi:superfamily II DNA/RNA helicase